jgi:hypothetical protein
MGWYGGTYGRPIRRRRTDETAWELGLEQVDHPTVPPNEHRRQLWYAVWPEEGLCLIPLPEGHECLPDWHERVLTRCRPSPPRGGSRRWTFVCTGCGRECRRLYALRFGGELECRLCHNLTYRSSQQWWRVDSTLRRMAYLLALAERGG